EEVKPDPLAPKLVEDFIIIDAPMPGVTDIVMTEHIKEEEPLFWELGPPANVVNSSKEKEKILSETTKVDSSINTVGKMFMSERTEDIHLAIPPKVNHEESTKESISLSTSQKEKELTKDSTTPVSAASGGYLARPSNIYAESKAEVYTSMP